MGRSWGAGQPIWFHCAGCKRVDRDHRSRWGETHTVDLTGRTRKARGLTTHGRFGDLDIEYRCPFCCHVGWSAHHDLADRYRYELAAGRYRYEGRQSRVATAEENTMPRKPKGAADGAIKPKRTKRERCPSCNQPLPPPPSPEKIERMKKREAKARERAERVLAIAERHAARIAALTEK